MEIIPDLNAPEGSPDPLLVRVLSAHVGLLSNAEIDRRIRFGHGRGRELHPDTMHQVHVILVANDDWAKEVIRQKILVQIWGGPDKGFPPEFYATTDTFRYEAGKCFKAHGRPADGCIDWEDHSKRLTDKAWEQSGFEQGLERKHVFLCSFCPVQSWVTTQIRLGRGDYA